MRGEQLALGAMRKEHARLVKAAERAKKVVDEYIAVGSELVAIHEELREIVISKQTGKDILEKLDALNVRKDTADKIRKMDMVKIMDKQCHAEFDRDAIARQIHNAEWQLNRRAQA